MKLNLFKKEQTKRNSQLFDAPTKLPKMSNKDRLWAEQLRETIGKSQYYNNIEKIAETLKSIDATLSRLNMR